MEGSIRLNFLSLTSYREVNEPLTYAVTETAPLIDVESAWASRWIRRSIRLYDEVAELDDDEDVEAAGVVSETLEPST